MLTRLIILTFVFFATACTPPVQYTWQDSRGQDREDASSDLEICRDFASRQYRPGIPAGEEYLKGQADGDIFSENNSGEWRPDRSPHKMVNTNAMPLHNVPTGYTGYPGELDYYPDYLDDIVEKCMRDRGWEYSEVLNGH